MGVLMETVCMRPLLRLGRAESGRWRLISGTSAVTNPDLAGVSVVQTCLTYLI